MKTKLIMLLSIFLPACVAAPSPTLQLMYKEGIPMEQIQRDTLQCKQLALQSVTSRGMGGNLFASFIVDNETRECMNFLGYK